MTDKATAIPVDPNEPSAICDQAYSAGSAVAERERRSDALERSRRALSFPIFLAALLVLGFWLAVTGRLLQTGAERAERTSSLLDQDTGWHLAVGEQILATHRWPVRDSYSFTAQDSPWVADEWLGEMSMALAVRLGGVRALTCLLLLFGTTFILLVYYLACLRCSNSKAAFVACAAILPMVFLDRVLGPQLLGYSCLIATLICIEHFRRARERALWVLPLLFALWVNCHPTFVVGIAVLALYYACGLNGFCAGSLFAERWTLRQRYCLLATLLFCLLALAVTPYGTGIAGHVLHTLLQPHSDMRDIPALAPLSDNVPLLKSFVALFVPFFLAHVLFRPRYRFDEFVLFAAAVYAGCVYASQLLLFMVAFPPMLAVLLVRWIPERTRFEHRPVLNLILAFIVLAGLWKVLPSKQELSQAASLHLPQQAVEYLRAHPITGNMFNEYDWGGYLVRAYAERKVFIDSRTELYEDGDVLADYLKIVQVDEPALRLLRKYNVQYCLLKRNSPVETLLGVVPDWQRVYSDQVSAIWARK